MVVPNMDPLAWVRKQLEEAEPDLLRAMVSAFADALMGAEVPPYNSESAALHGWTSTATGSCGLCPQSILT